MGSKTCPACGGSGNPAISGVQDGSANGCMTCGGQGWVYDYSDDYDIYDNSDSGGGYSDYVTDDSNGYREQTANTNASGGTQQAAASPPWSNGWAILGALVGAFWAFSLVENEIKTNNDLWFIVILAAGFAAGIAGRFYKIIIGLIILAVILMAVGAYNDKNARAQSISPSSAESSIANTIRAFHGEVTELDAITFWKDC